MDEMFFKSSNLISVDISDLNTENVITLKDMFRDCSNLVEINFTNLNTEKVESTSGLFSGCKSLTNIDISNLELENIKDMSSMFSQCNSLKSINFGTINTKNVYNMSNLFNDCNSLELVDLSLLNTENVIDMSHMFKDCKSLQELNLDFNTENVENMSYMFSSCTALTSLNITMFETENCNNFLNMFENDKELQIYIDSNKCRNLINFIPDDISIVNIPTKTIIGEINCVYNIKTIENNIILLGKEFEHISELDMYLDNRFIKYSKEYKISTIGEHNIQFILYEDLNMDYMFKDVPDLISVEMKSENDCQILSMISTFENAKNLYEFNITGFSGEEIKSMNKLFYKSALNNFYFNFFETNNLEDISYMFSNTEIIDFSLNGIDTSNVKNMSHLFEDCQSLRSFNNEGFETNKVIDMSSMFEKSY